VNHQTRKSKREKQPIPNVFKKNKIIDANTVKSTSIGPSKLKGKKVGSWDGRISAFRATEEKGSTK